MTVQLDPHWSNFLQTARRLNLLSSELVDQLTDESRTLSRSPVELVVQKGWLSQVQVDIVSTLMHPTTTIPGYEILNLLGQGGMGVVYRARQLNLDRTVALKTVLLNQMGEQQTALARFRQEAITVAKLQHPNIVTAYDFGQHEGRLYFAMEYIEGEDLDSLIHKQGVIDPGTALGLVRQVVAGLSHAAQLGIVHRDIKPANLLLVEAPEGFGTSNGLPMVKIADFGLAFLTAESDSRTRLTMNNAAVGSPHYLAPEQLSGQPVDHRADIYALGATLYHMLSGHPPFAAENVAQIIAKKLSGKLQPIANLSEPMHRFLEQLMQIDPADRFADYNLIRKEIDRLSTSILPETIFVSPHHSSIAVDSDMPGVTQALPNNTATANETATTGAATLGAESYGNPAATRTGLPWETMAEMPQQVRQSPPSTSSVVHLPKRRKWTAILAAAVGLCALSFGIWWYGTSNETPPVRDLTTGGRSEHLFDGRTLTGWITTSGGWFINQDEDGGFVLAGENGTIRRQLPRIEPTDSATSMNYRLTLVVTLNLATSVEVEFDLPADVESSASRRVLQITGLGFQLGEKKSDAVLFEPLSKRVDVKIDPQKPYEVQIERHSTHWWVFFDGKVVGTIPVGAKKELAEFRLSVEGGPVHFSDLFIENLVAKASESR
ncbi:MAG: serine/threonine-protein kinase [Planctomycetaceae bacterium]